MHHLLPPSVALSDLEHFAVNSFWHFEGGGAGVGLGRGGEGRRMQVIYLAKASPIVLSTFDFRH